MREPQTKSELPKNGASTRLAAISTPEEHRPAEEDRDADGEGLDPLLRHSSSRSASVGA